MQMLVNDDESLRIFHVSLFIKGIKGRKDQKILAFRAENVSKLRSDLFIYSAPASQRLFHQSFHQQPINPCTILFVPRNRNDIAVLVKSLEIGAQPSWLPVSGANSILWQENRA